MRLPQPVEIDPRLHDHLPPLQPRLYHQEPYGDIPLLIDLPGLEKIGGSYWAAAPPLCYESRSAIPRDPISEWYEPSKSQPWVAKWSLPEATPGGRPPNKGYTHTGGASVTWSPESEAQGRSSYVSGPSGFHNGILSSDSGYGSAVAPENASTRGSEVVDHSPEMRDVSRVMDFQYSETVLPREQDRAQWTRPEYGVPFWCDVCLKPLRLKSDLKYVVRIALSEHF
jgi:hypothetical protein